MSTASLFPQAAKSMAFTVYVKPQPQGSAKAFVRGGHAVITSDNKKLTPFRNEVTAVVLKACRDAGCQIPLAGKHEPVAIKLAFYFEKPPSVPKRRVGMVFKPDADKLVRSVFDSLTGVLFADDAQVIELAARKAYGTPERVEIWITI